MRLHEHEIPPSSDILDMKFQIQQKCGICQSNYNHEQQLLCRNTILQTMMNYVFVIDKSVIYCLKVAKYNEKLQEQKTTF